MDNNWASFISQLPPIPQPIKRKVFASYHHKNDQYWYNHFSDLYSDKLGIFYDNSLERKEASDNAVYLNRKIREEYIAGTSVTIVLCGVETNKRRWVDWEIHATLEYKHALLAIMLPSLDYQLQKFGHVYVPMRLADNIKSGYAHFVSWPQNYQELVAAIEIAIQKSANKSLLQNGRLKMQRNLQ